MGGQVRRELAARDLVRWPPRCVVAGDAVIAAGVAAGVHRAWPGLITPRPWPWARAHGTSDIENAGSPAA